MSTKKMIQINPELFKWSGNKTRKLEDKKNKPSVPLISPNHLKNKLLNRIKEHKQKEIQDKNKNLSNRSVDKDTKAEYSDEFYGALDYLSELSKKQSTINTNTTNRTLKNYSSSSPAYSMPHVELELPPELQEPVRPFSLSSSPSIKLKYEIDKEVPHGCLRGGKKPTYRIWQNQTRKNYPEPVNTDPSRLSSSNPSVLLSREQRLEQIKHKLKNLEVSSPSSVPVLKMAEKPTSLSFHPAITSNENEEAFSSSHQPSMYTINKISNTNTTVNADKMVNIPQIVNTDKMVHANTQIVDTEPLPPSKKYIKKTIKRKYTLGKSNVYRKVGVLIKDKQTRKNILHAYKDLKKTPLTDIKKYLKGQGIIKVGTTAPNDILRKTFEASRMAGEIKNTNADTLLHNFINGDEPNDSK